MVTIKEIAREAGVSFTTVSNVIHGNNCRVSPETAERVREIMRKTGYIPNMGARALVSNATKLIAFAYQSYRSLDGINSLQDPFISELVGGLERKIHEEGYDMILSVLDTFENMNDAARRWNVDGMQIGCRFKKNTKNPGKKSRFTCFLPGLLLNFISNSSRSDLLSYQVRVLQNFRRRIDSIDRAFASPLSPLVFNSIFLWQLNVCGKSICHRTICLSCFIIFL